MTVYNARFVVHMAALAWRGTLSAATTMFDDFVL